MKSRLFCSGLLLSLSALVVLSFAGCGGSSNTNVVTVSILPGTASVIVSQSLTLTATVSGSTNLNVTWMCQFTTTTVDSTGKTTTSAAAACTADTGTIPANSTNTTVIYTAPNKVPDPTKFPNMQIIITATSAADTKKNGTATLVLDSGIAVTLTPSTATVPTGEQQGFNATLTNDLQNQGVTFLITQGTATATIPPPSLTSCSPTCGTIDATSGIYTAPASVPTTATLTIVATSKADTTRFALGTITIIQGGPITFNSISPTIAPQGASFYDLYLDAPFLSSASTITITGQNSGIQTVITSASGQFKVLFPIPTSTVTNPPSTGARLRLTAQNLLVADTYTISVSDPVQPITKGSGPFTFSIVPVRPSAVASIPDSVVKGSTNELPLAIDGGYFGANGQLAVANFNGNNLPQNTGFGLSSRQLNLLLPTSAINAAQPGLYPLSVSRNTAPLPSPNNPSITNLAVFPDFSTSPPLVGAASFPAGTKPSAVDIDTRRGILAVAETGSNLVQFFSVSKGSLTPLPCPTTSCAVNSPTGLSINQANHTVAVVSPQDQSVVVLPLPGSTGATGVTYPLTISLAGLIPSNVTPLPLPYSIGVDPDTNNAVVAYTSAANPTTAKVGFLLDLNAGNANCLPSLPSGTKSPCVHAQVTLNTGLYPQVAMVPHSHLALVTPGGTGVIEGIDVTKASAQLAITNINVTSGLATVTVNVPSGQTLGLNPGNAGTVLIQGVPNGANNTNFNGVFTIQSVSSTNMFTYALSSTVNDNTTGNSSSFAFFSNPNLEIGISQTAQGIAINPITRTAAIADADSANGPQVDFLNSLDQSVTSLTFRSGCTAFTLNCSGAPDPLSTSSVAFQPYTNLLVSYNPQQNQVSISNPVTQTRYALACILPPGSCLTNPDQTVQNDLNIFLSQTTLPGTGTSSISVSAAGTTATLTLFGGLAVDPATNQAFVVESGSNEIRIVDLGPSASSTPKAAQITELQVPTVSGALIGGIAGASMPQGTLTSTSDLANVQIFGAGFDSSTQVRLDGTSIGLGTVQPGGRVLNVTIPASFLAAPHHYSVDVVNGSGVQSNVTDFFVIKAVDLKSVCTGGNPQPSSVAIADQLPGQAFSPIAVVSNSGCNNVSVIDINPQSASFGAIKSSIPTGGSPAGVAVSPRFGFAVVANSTDGTASVLDLTTGTQKVPAVTVGTTPTGVAISEGTGAALITNTGSNTVSELNLALLSGSSPATSLSAISIAIDTSPIAVAIDPDRGTNNRGLAVVTAVQLVSGSAPVGVFDAIDIGGASPAKSTSVQTGSVTATPTGLVFNPSVSPALFYATSSGGNVVTTYNPDGTTATSSVHVGINPTSLAINPQTGGIVTVNSASQTISIIDTISNPFKTRSSFGLGGSSQFGVAIDQFTNLAVIADQANNRVLIFQVPN
jgi:DNA-binding beta-propeller fold protein YncE